MYVLVRKDLSKSQQAVQAGHALAEYLLRVQPHSWSNGTLIYLEVENEKELQHWGDKLDMNGHRWTCFREPDIGNQVTAISTVSDKNPFKKLKLLEL